VIFEVITLFPGVFPGPLGAGVVGRAIERGVLGLGVHDLRESTGDKHRQVDDVPYGGGPGMVLKPEPIFKAVRRLQESGSGPCVLLTPQGRLLDQKLAAELATLPRVILVAGRYEGFDERIRVGLADDEVSIGDYILSGGELAAMVLIEVVARYVPGVLGDDTSAASDSFSGGLLEHPQYTRPVEFEGQRVPDVLLSGNHEMIRRWREEMATQRTRSRRPELLKTSTGTARPRAAHKGEPE
jgi:tRNA (guanine37-N1)-methyltransferase